MGHLLMYLLVEVHEYVWLQIVAWNVNITCHLFVYVLQRNIVDTMEEREGPQLVL